MRTYQLDQRDGESKYYYLYKELKADILSGTIKAGEKLPSKRTLAEHLGVSLITVENAYLMLKEEGYIESRERSGYYANGILEFAATIEQRQARKGTERILHLLPEKNNMAEMAQQSKTTQETEREQNLLPSSNFPYSVYFKTVRSVITDYGEQLMQKSPNEGCAILRNAISNYLLRYRGIFAQPSQIIIGSGAEHLYGCVVRLFGKESVYGIEDPSYEQIQKVYEGAGAVCEKLKMGVDGIASEELVHSEAKILHVTPFHSYPSGVTATIQKRYEYLNWAMERKGYIIEDDFDSEFFMPGKPIETLYAMDQGKSVLYINTFSKSLSPSIRMGYMILPPQLMERYQETSGGFSCTVPVMEQYALAEFINKGYFEQHLNRMRKKNRL